MRPYKKTRRGIHVNNHRYGMGVMPVEDYPKDSPYRRVKSPKKFIKVSDGITCMTFMYMKFGITGYGCAKVECIHRKAQTLLERYGEKICWKDR